MVISNKQRIEQHTTIIIDHNKYSRGYYTAKFILSQIMIAYIIYIENCIAIYSKYLITINNNFKYYHLLLFSLSGSQSK